MPTLDFQVALNLVRDTAKEMGVDPDTATKVYGVENRGQRQVNTETVSSAGAQGIMQVMPQTLQSLQNKGFLASGVDYQRDPRAQIRAGVAALKELNSRGITDPTEMAIGYNASPAVLEAYRAGKAIPAETANYIRLFHGGTGPTNMATSTSQRTSTTTRSLPSGVEQELFDSIDKTSEMSASTQTALADLTKQYTASNTEKQAAVTEAGQDKAQSIVAKGREDTGTVDNAYSMLSAYGINPNDGGNQLVLESTQRIDQIQRQRMDLQREVSTLKSTPVTDPLNWIVNNFKAMPLITQHNALVSEENNAKNNIRMRQELAQNQSAIQPAAIQDEIRTKALADATLAKADADSTVAGLKGDAIQMQARTLIETMNAQRMDSQTQIQVAKMFMDKQMQSQGVTYADKQEAKEAADLAPLNMKLMALIPGRSAINPTMWKAMPAEMRDRLSRFTSMSGEGTDLAESVSTIKELGGPQAMRAIAEKNAPLGVLIKNAVEGGQVEMQKGLNPAPGMPLPAELKMAKTDDDRLQWGIRQWQNRMLADLQAKDYTKLTPDNPYKFKPGIVANIPSLSANPFAQYIKQNIAENGGGITMTIDDKQLFTQALARVKNGEDVTKVSNELEEFYIKGYKAQTESQSTTAMGLPYKADYPLQLSISSMGKRKVQALNGVSIENFLTGQYAASKSVQNSPFANDLMFR